MSELSILKELIWSNEYVLQICTVWSLYFYFFILYCIISICSWHTVFHIMLLSIILSCLHQRILAIPSIKTIKFNLTELNWHAESESLTDREKRNWRLRTFQIRGQQDCPCGRITLSIWLECERTLKISIASTLVVYSASFLGIQCLMFVVVGEFKKIIWFHLDMPLHVKSNSD